MSVASFVAAQRTEHGVPHASDLPGSRAQRVVVLQVAQPASDAAPAAAGGAG